MKKQGYIVSIIILITFLVYLTGCLPCLSTNEQRLEYIVRTLKTYKGIEVIYNVNYNSMEIHGIYQWHEKEKQHRLKGEVESKDMQSELISFNGMIQENTIYFDMEPIKSKVYKYEIGDQINVPFLSSIENVFQIKDIYACIQEGMEATKPVFKIKSINNQLIGVYIVEGNIKKQIDFEEIHIDYILAIDGWGNIKKVDISIGQGERIFLSGTINPIRKYSIMELNTEDAIDFY